MVDLPQPQLNLTHLCCSALTPFLNRTIRVTDLLLVQLPRLEVRGGAGWQCVLKLFFSVERVGLVEGVGGEGVEVAIGGAVQVFP